MAFEMLLLLVKISINHECSLAHYLRAMACRTSLLLLGIMILISCVLWYSSASWEAAVRCRMFPGKQSDATESGILVREQNLFVSCTDRWVGGRLELLWTSLHAAKQLCDGRQPILPGAVISSYLYMSTVPTRMSKAQFICGNRVVHVEVFAKIFYGDPAKKLYEAVDLVPLNCLVVGNRGLSTLKRALMGSVSSYVVNNATCPVTVVKENR